MQSNNIILTAFVGGLVPALLWLFFWLREDKEHPEPRGLLFITFVAGMASVILVLPFEQLAQQKIGSSISLTILWAAAEEIIKLLIVVLIVFKTSQLDEPVDYPIYFITAALGFAALENTLFLLTPLGQNEVTVSLLTGNLRFLGATLLHAVCSSIIGISLGLAFFSTWINKKIALFTGLFTAVALHALFNFFIIKGDGQNFLAVFAFLWVITIITILLFEKLRRMGEQYQELTAKAHLETYGTLEQKPTT